MTAAKELLASLENLDIKLWVEEDRLLYDAPEGTLTPELKQEVKAHKAEIISILKLTNRSWTYLVPIQPDGSKPPLFLCQAIHRYQLLTDYLGSEQPVYGLAAEYEQGKSVQFGQLEELAAHYIEEMRTLQPQGPYYLGGLCFGGVIAYEIAQQLILQDQRVALLAMFDTFKPGPDAYRPLLLENLQEEHSQAGNNLAGLAMREAFIQGVNHYRDNYIPQVYPDKVTLFAAIDREDASATQPRGLGWAELVTEGLEIHEVPGGHLSILEEPNVRHLANKLKVSLDRAQGVATSEDMLNRSGESVSRNDHQKAFHALSDFPPLEDQKQALAKPFVAPRNEVERKLTAIWETLLGTQPIGVQDDFFVLGGNSLLSIRLIGEIEKAFHQKLTLINLYKFTTIEQLAQFLYQTETPSSSQSGLMTSFPNDSHLVPIQPHGSKPPLFLCHAVHRYQLLSLYLGSEQPVYGLSGDYEQGKPVRFERLEELAAQYVKEVRNLQSEGPYWLGGLCFGGVIAYEMAQQLILQGQRVALLAIFEPPPSPTTANLRQEPLAQKRITHHLSRLLQTGPTFLLRRLKRRVIDRIRAKVVLKSKFFRFGDDIEGLVRREAFLQGVKHYLADYIPKPYSGRMTFFIAGDKDDASTYQYEAGINWAELVAGGLEMHEVPGGHLSILEEPNVRHLANKLKVSLDRAQEVATSEDMLNRSGESVSRNGHQETFHALSDFPPDIQKQASAKPFVAPRNEVERKLTAIWETLLGTQPIGVQDDFFVLGGNSLLSIRLIGEIEKAFHQKLTLINLYKFTTIEQLAQFLHQLDEIEPQQDQETALVGQSDLTPKSLDGLPQLPLEDYEALLATNAGRPGKHLGPRGLVVEIAPEHCSSPHPFIWVCKTSVAQNLGLQQPSYVLPPFSLTAIKDTSIHIQALASLYVDEILTLQPEGPYFIGGFCYGGWVAYEMAQQLQKQGKEVALLVLINRQSPSVPYAVFHQLSSYYCTLKRDLRNLLKLKSQERTQYVSERAKYVLTRMFTGLLPFLKPQVPPKVFTNPSDMQKETVGQLKQRETWKLVKFYIKQAMKSYNPQPYNGKLLLFFGDMYYSDPSNHEEDIVFPDLSTVFPLRGWGNLAKGDVEIYSLPYMHSDLVNDTSLAADGLVGKKLRSYVEQVTS